MAEMILTTFSTTGADTIPVSALPSVVELFVSAKYNATQAYTHFSSGIADGTNQRADSITQNTTTGRTLQPDLTRILKLYELTGSTFTVVLEVEVTSFTATDINVYVHVANANYQVRGLVHY